MLSLLKPSRWFNQARPVGFEEIGVVETYTGRKVNLYDPQVADISIFDVAASLSKQCRYNGHCDLFYSVAQHSVEVSSLIEASEGDTNQVLRGLLHDAGEAYIGDVVKPFKDSIPEIGVVEDCIHSVILARFGLTQGSDKNQIEIKQADLQALRSEAHVLMESKGLGWGIDHMEPSPDAAGMFFQPPIASEFSFLVRFAHLYGFLNFETEMDEEVFFLRNRPGKAAKVHYLGSRVLKELTS